MNENLKAALSYAQRGWFVFPLHGIKDGKCTCRSETCDRDAGKHPITRRGWKDASKDESVVELWFVDEHFNVGIATGEKSGITVLDIDTADGKKGAETWTSLTSERGEPQTLMQETGSGGLHVFFQYNSALKSSANTLGPGVDCRNDGGYIVAPPSRHRSGGTYRWINDAPVVALPSYLTKKPEKKRERKKKKQYSLDDIKAMLAVIPSDDRDLWRNVGVILGREFERSEDAWNAYNEWSDKWGGQKGRNHDEIMREAFYDLSQQGGDLSLGTIIHLAQEAGWVPKVGSVPIENFLYYAPGNQFIYRPTKEFWTSAAVDAATSPVNLKGELVPASSWLRINCLITSMTSDPLIEDIRKEWDCLNGIMIPSKGGSLYNTYRPPIIELGDPKKCDPWLEHVHRIFNRPGDADQFLNYMAHRVQYPGMKPRFALALIGEQGIGKDTAIQFAAPAIGEWNVESIKPEEIQSSFNEYASKVLVIVSEVANAEDMSKWTFNEKMKVLIAGMPDYMTVNPKYGHKFSVRLHCGVIITTNHISGLYIPHDDRRYDVIQCPSAREIGLTDDSKKAEYFGRLNGWYHAEKGASHVAAYLHARDISGWNPNTGQRKTAAHGDIVAAGYDGDQWALDALEKLGSPSVITLNVLVAAINSDQITPREVKARIGHVMPRLGWCRLVNPKSADGRWKIGEGSTAVFYDPRRIKKEDAMTVAFHGNVRKEAF